MVKRWRLRHFLAREIADFGEAELSEAGKFVRSGDLFLDIGSNMGVYSFLMARLGCRVIAFEPNPAMVDSVRLLDIDVDVRQIALSSKNAIATLTIPDEHGLATLRSDALLHGGFKSISVQTQRLDSFALQDVAFVKIDVEGVEEQVLEGGTETIARDKPALLIEIEERHNPGGLSRICERLGRLGYSAFYLDDGAWKPVSSFNASRDQRIEGIDAMQAGASRRSVRYINNFLFLPPGRSIPGAG